MDEFIRLNIAIILSKEISKFAIKVSKELSEKYKTEFTLDGKNYFPHITVYPVEIAKKDLKSFVVKTREVVEKTAKFNIKFGRFWTASENGECWVGIPVIKNEKLKLFHKHVVSGLNLSGKVHTLAYETYNPHLTLTSFVGEIDPENIVLPQLKSKTMEVNKVGIFEMGLHGTCKKLLHEFDLKKSI
jgi:2'-5' RNA ligase